MQSEKLSGSIAPKPVGGRELLPLLQQRIDNLLSLARQVDDFDLPYPLRVAVRVALTIAVKSLQGQMKEIDKFLQEEGKRTSAGE